MPDLLRDQLQASLGTAYTLERELGGGGMSRVFVARETALGRDVVVKVLAPELAEGLSAERFTREIRLAAALQEPHIVPVLAAGTTAEALPWYTMPFVEGQSLRERLRRAPVSGGEAVAILRDVARALAYAHARGIVHRDVKPENVLLSSGTAVVTDFGIAKALSASKTHAPDGPAGGTLTWLGTSLGTPAYMAPEQAAGDAVDARADVYSWGVVAYELLAGRHPFAGKGTAQQLIAAHIAESPAPLPPTVGDALAALVMRCLAKEPAARPTTAADVLPVLDATPAATTPTPASRAARTRRWSRRVALTALPALAALALGGWYGVLSPADRATLGVLARRKSVELRVDRVVVAPLRNETGDPALAVLGPLAADVLTSGLSTLPDLEVVDARTAQASGEVARHIPRLFRRRDAGLALADEVGAGVVIDGSYFRDGDSVRVRARVLDAASGAVRKALPEVAVAPGAPAAGLGQLAERTVAFLKGVTNRDMPMDVREFDVPRSLAAADAWFAGYAAYMRDDTTALAHVGRMVALDTGWASAYAYRAFFLADLLGPRGWARVDSAVRAAEPRAGRMTPTARALLAGAAATQRGDARGYLASARTFLAVVPASPVGRYFVSSAALWARQPRLTLAMLRDVDPDRGVAVPLAEWHWEEVGMAAAQFGDWAGAGRALAEMHRRVPQSARGWNLELAVAAAHGDTAALPGARERGADVEGTAGLTRTAEALALLAVRGGHMAAARALASRWSDDPAPSLAALRNGAALAVVEENWPAALARTEAAAWATSLGQATWTDSLEWLGARAVALAHAGRGAEARALELRVAAREHRSMGAGIPTLVRARIAAHLGETARALDLAEQAVARGVLRFVAGLATIDSDPFLLPLRAEPRFVALARPAAVDR